MEPKLGNELGFFGSTMSSNRQNELQLEYGRAAAYFIALRDASIGKEMG
jgi:hypothetical protein